MLSIIDTNRIKNHKDASLYKYKPNENNPNEPLA